MNVLSIAAAAFLAAAAVEPKSDPGPAPTAAEAPGGDPYPVGETLIYRVKVIGIPAGTATVKVEGREKTAGREAAKLTLSTKANWLARAIAAYDLTIVSLVDVATGGTLKFRLDEKQKKNKRKIEEFTWDPATNVVNSTRQRPPRPAQPAKCTVDGPVQDVLSMTHHARRLKLDLGKFEPMTVFQGHKQYPGRIAADGMEQIKVKGVGTFWALVLHPETAGPALFSKGGQATLWVEETTHVMLKMVVKGGKGSGSLTLLSAEKSALLDAPGAAPK
ncbi:MAG: DUF3108 domain-containing protein [Planctomycetota bacterium]